MRIEDRRGGGKSVKGEVNGGGRRWSVGELNIYHGWERKMSFTAGAAGVKVSGLSSGG